MAIVPAAYIYNTFYVLSREFPIIMASEAVVNHYFQLSTLALKLTYYAYQNEQDAG